MLPHLTSAPSTTPDAQLTPVYQDMEIASGDGNSHTFPRCSIPFGVFPRTLQAVAGC